MKSHFFGAACVCAIVFAFSISVHAAAISGQGTWETTLQGRDLDGNLSTAEAYYDTSLNITWLANANYASTTMTWNAANAWAAGLNFNGITGWRLPTVNPVDGTTADDTAFSYIGTEDKGYNISAPSTLYAGSTASEMAHLYYNTLRDTSYCALWNPYGCGGPPTGWGLTNTGPFSNFPAGYYWSATEYAPDTNTAWFFGFLDGYQTNAAKTFDVYAWAVHSGDIGASVSSVPVPAAVWLFGSGIVGLFGFCVASRLKEETA